jgi:Calx-beta domain
MLKCLFYQASPSRRGLLINLGLILTLIVPAVAFTAGNTLTVKTYRNELFSHLRAHAKTTLAGSTMQFVALNYPVNEVDGKVVLTVNRSGDTSGSASIDFATNSGAPPASCGTSNGIASEACDYTMRLGTLQFAANETSKTVTIFINDDSYAEATETFTITLSNPNTGSTIGTPATTTVTITDNDVSSGQSAVKNGVSFNNSFFVRQQYIDFLNREPDAPGLVFWKNQLDECETLPLPRGFTDAQTCREVRRINVSAAFFVSIEFQNTAYLIYRLNQAAFNSGPTLQLRSFLKDTQEIQRGVIVGQGNWEQEIANNKAAFVNAFVTSAEFIAAFPPNMTAASFVDLLNVNTKDPSNPTTGSLNQAERDNLVATLSANPSNPALRAQTLRAIAENSVFQQREFSRAFVLMQYFGYLRRNPNALPDTDFAGYNFWFNKLNSFGGNYIDSEMVKAFIASGEYIGRFGPASSIGPALTVEQRLAALDAVKAKFELLKNGANQSTVNQELLNFIQSRPEFAEAGISTDSCVWATYTDGVQLIVINNRNADRTRSPSPAPRLSVAQSVSANPQPENLPDSTKARLLFALDGIFRNPVPDIRTWMNEANYLQPSGEGAKVPALKTVGGDGVFFFEGHGGTRDKSGDPGFSLSTATEMTPANDRALEADLYESTDPASLGRVRLNYMVVDNGLFGSFSAKAVYGITSEFIRFYWGRFSPNSFVFINACSSASPKASGFAFAIKEKGASVYAGWTQPVTNLVIYDSAQFVFDRLLGANKIYLESDGFKTRAFDYQSVADDLVKHHLGHDSETGADLVFTPFAGNGDFQLLAPSIWFMEVDSYLNKLTIHGEFGDDPGENNRGVTVGGLPCHVTWSKNLILLDLPVSGPGSSGEVIVTVRQQKSNTAYLTEWEGDFTHTVTDQGTLKQTATYHIRIRADIREVRNHIHEVVSLIADRAVVATEDSGYSYECSGSFTQTFPGPSTCTETWSGAGSLPRLPLLPTGTGFLAIGHVNTTRLTFQLNVLAKSARLVNSVCSPGGSTDKADSLFSAKVGNDGTFVAVVDPQFAIVGNTLTATDINGFHTLTWNLIRPKAGSAPKPDSPR